MATGPPGSIKARLHNIWSKQYSNSGIYRGSPRKKLLYLQQLNAGIVKHLASVFIFPASLTLIRRLVSTINKIKPCP